MVLTKRKSKNWVKQQDKQEQGQNKKVLKMLEKQKKERGKQQRKYAPPNSSQQSLAYQAIYENGVCEVKEGVFSRTFQFSDINYSIADQSEQEMTFSSYCELLNSCDGDTALQISIINRNKDKVQFEKDLTYDLADDELDLYRKEMNTMISDKIKHGNSSLQKEKYVTFIQKAKDVDQAIPALNRLQGDLVDQFVDLGCQVEELSGLDRLKVANSILRPDTNLYFEYEDLLFSGLTTHSAIAPDSFDFKYRKNRFLMGDEYTEVLYLRTYPSELSDRLINDLTDIPTNLQIALHIEPFEQQKGLDLVKTKLTFMEQQKIDEQKKALRGGYDPQLIGMELRRSMSEAEDLLDQMQSDNEKLFSFTFLVMASNKDESLLDETVEQILAAGRKNNCAFSKLNYLQEEALNSILMWGYNYVPISRTLTTASTAVFIPFTAQELMQPKGKYYGLNAVTKNLVTLDRKTLKAPNGFILGTPGSGKSFATKKEMTAVLLSDPDAEVIVIDPEREYTPLAEALQGEVIHISAGSKAHVNPLEINNDYADDDDPVILKTDFVLSLCDMLVGGNMGLSPTQKTLIDRACRFAYKNYFEGQKEMPTLRDFSEILKQQPEEEAQQLAVELELYTEGSLSVFSHQTNVDTTKRFVVFDVKDLGKQLRSMGMLIILDQIWNRITSNRNAGRRTWVYIDEIQLLFSNEYAENYFFELWSRARKWGAIPTGITQNVSTLLSSLNAERMLSNSDFVLMLNQSQTDRQRLAELLHISNRQQKYITNAKEGAGLLYADEAMIPLYDEFPKDTELYKVMSTKIEDVYKYQNERQKQEIG